MDENNLDLSEVEKELISGLTYAFYHSRQTNALNMDIQKKLVGLFQTQSQDTLKKMSKTILANFIAQPLKRVVTFAKFLPDFCSLEVTDQLTLLHGGAMEIFIGSSSSLYDKYDNKLVNIISKENRQGVLDANSNEIPNVQLDILRLVWTEDVFEKTISFLKSMVEMELDETTLVLFIPLVLFSPDRPGIQNRHDIYQIQCKFSFLLKKYMFQKYGLGLTETNKLYNKLLLKLVELRTLHELHSSLLLDVDPSQLEPFPMAFILNEKHLIERLNNKGVSQDQTDENVHVPLGDLKLNSNKLTN